MKNKFIFGFGIFLLIAFIVTIGAVVYDGKDNFKSGKLKVTEEHPFYINNTWIPASNLQVGDLLTTIDGKKARITSIKDIQENVSVYNLEDDVFHNYVASSDGEVGVVVHNSNKVPPKKDPDFMKNYWDRIRGLNINIKSALDLIRLKPSEALDALVLHKRAMLEKSRLNWFDNSGKWRSLVVNEGPSERIFVRMVTEEEMKAILKDGKVTSRYVAEVIKSPCVKGYEGTKHLDLRDSLYEWNDAAVKWVIKRDYGSAVSGGRNNPVLPVSAWGPANTGYLETVLKGQRYFIVFKPSIFNRLRISGNNALSETEYLIPLWYKLDDVLAIGNVNNPSWIYLSPGI